MRRKLAALAVVALVVVAGCTGGNPAADGSPEDPLYESPLDAQTVTDAHVDALHDAGSFTIQSDATRELVDENQSTETSSVVRGDVTSGAVFSRTESSQQTVELYASGNGTAYQRFVVGNQTQYQDVSGQAGNASQYAHNTVSSLVGMFEFSHTGTESTDDGTVHVYEAGSVDAVNTSSPAFAQVEASAIDEATATLRVRDDGVVVSAGYDVTITVQNRTQRVDTTQQFTAVGDTDVAEPAWLDDAQSNASA